VELAAGFGEGAMVGYCTEVAKMSEFHRAPLFRSLSVFPMGRSGNNCEAYR
jgi:hypothetical protein